MIKWDKDHSDDQFEVEHDGHWEPDEDPVDNWPDEVQPDHELNPHDEFVDWNHDVEIDPLWNEVDNEASPSCKPVEYKPNWNKYKLVDHVWNKHYQPPAELEDWKHDVPDDFKDESLDHENESKEQLNHHSWDVNDE